MATENQGVLHFQELLNRLYHFSSLTTNTLTLEDLEQVKQCWEKVLFVEKSVFDDEKYEDFQFVVNWFDDTAGPKTYHGLRSALGKEIKNDEVLSVSSTSFSSSSSLVPEHILDDIQRCIGDDACINQLLEDMDVKISNDNMFNITETADAFTNTNDSSETDVSCKISLTNKIRTLLDEHSTLKSVIATKYDLIERIYKWYYNDMYYREKETSANEISSDKEFRQLYIYGFTSLLASLDTSDTGKMQKLKIRRASTSMVESFLSRSNILLLYNLHSIHQFHQKVWDVVKFCFRNNEDCEEICSEIENYSVLNPIFSILKPLVRQLLDEESRSYDSSQSTNSLSNKEIKSQVSIQHPTVTDDQEIPHIQAPLDEQMQIIPVKKLTSLMEKVINPQHENIASLRRLPKLFQIYASLLADDSIPPELDPFYCNVSKSADHWVSGDITAVEFYSELYSFSLVPSSRDSDEASLNSVNLRLAYMLAERELHIERRYFIKLIDAYSNLKKVSTIMDRGRLYLGPTFRMWHIESRRYDQLNSKSNDFLGKSLKKMTLRLWRHEYEQVFAAECKANLRILQYWLSLWKTKYGTQRSELKIRLENFETLHVERKCYKALILTYRLRKWEKNNSAGCFAGKQVFIRWKHRTDDYQKLCLQANAQRNIFLEKFAYACWKCKSLGKFKIDTLLARTEVSYTLSRYFAIWQQQFCYRAIKKVVEDHNKITMERYAFQYWQDLYKLRSRSLELQHKSSSRKVRLYFDFWKKAHNMRQLADKKHRDLITKRYFNTWILQLHFVYALSNSNVHVARCMLEKWRLEARCQKFGKRSENKRVVICFKLWKVKYSCVKESLVVSSEETLKLQIGAHFDFWRHHTEEQIVNKKKWEESAHIINVKHNTAIIRRTFSRWRERTEQSERDNEIEMEHLHRFEFERIMRPKFSLWLKRCLDIRRSEMSADVFYDNVLKLKYMLKILNEYDHNLQLMEIYQSHSNLKDLELLKRVMSQMSLKMIKYRTDYRNADLFKARWAKISKDAFFGIWKMRFDARKSARRQKQKEQQQQQQQQQQHQQKYSQRSQNGLSDDTFNRTLTSITSYDSLRNPYIDTSDTLYSESRLASPLTERSSATAATKLTSWKSNSTTHLMKVPSLAPESPTSFSRISPPKLFRTPMRKMNMSLSSSAKRVRRFNLEQRVNHYRQAKKSPEKESDNENTNVGRPLGDSEDATAPPTPTKSSRIVILGRQRN